MAMTPDPLLGGQGGPLPPPDPRDPRSYGDRAPDDRDEDPARDEHELLHTASHALSDDEKEAAEHDPGRQPRTYAPSSERVPKAPTPGDAKVIEQGLQSEDANARSEHMGDR